MQLWGAIDSSGAWRIQPQFIHLGDFSDSGLAVAQYETGKTYVDTQGNTAGEALYYAVRHPHGGTFVAATDRDHWGIKKLGGGWILRPSHPYIGFFHDGLATIEAGGRTGYIDTSGRMRIPARYDVAHEFRDGLAQVERRGFRGFVSVDGDEAIRLPRGCLSLGFESGHACLMSSRETIFIDRLGNSVRRFPGPCVGRAFDGGFIVKRDGRSSVHSFDGTVMMQFDCENVSVIGGRALAKSLAGAQFFDLFGRPCSKTVWSDAEQYSAGLAVVEKDGLSGYIDFDGSVVIDFRFSLALSFSFGLASVACES